MQKMDAVKRCQWHWRGVASYVQKLAVDTETAISFAHYTMPPLLIVWAGVRNPNIAATVKGTTKSGARRTHMFIGAHSQDCVVCF